jgi:hypothetical protein
VQTATIDQIAGLANLTTFLRTRPGMIESDWPVCAITDTATHTRAIATAIAATTAYAARYGAPRTASRA